MTDKNVIIVCVSREVLEGVVVDRNAAFMAARITDLGLRLRTIQVVDREEAEMVAAVKWALDQKPAFLIMTGGMGPSYDDNSRACAAKGAGLELERNQQALDYVRASYQRLHAKGAVDTAELNDERSRMAMLPKGSKCFENPIGSAPAVQFSVGGTTVFLLPGVPAEMQRLFTLYVLPAMTSSGPSTVRKQRQVEYFGHDESAISRVIQDISRRHKEVKVRTRVQGTEDSRMIRITMHAEHHDPVVLEDLLERAEMDLRARLGMEIDRPSHEGE